MPASSANDPVNPPQPPNPTQKFPSDGYLEATEPAIDLLNADYADITQDKVEAALKRLKRNKPAGVDGPADESGLSSSWTLLTCCY